jgi:hypothetical protein
MKSSLLNVKDDQQEPNWMLFRSMMDDEEDCQQLSKHTNRNQNQVVDTIVNAATICNSLVSEYCSLCTFYLDRQVQYELTSSTFLGGSSLETHERRKVAGDVAEVAMMLFDEESVVASVSSR